MAAPDPAPQLVVEVSVRDLGDRRYGLPDFAVRDLDGFGLRFASWLPAGPGGRAG